MSFRRGARSGGFPQPGEELKDVPGRHNRDGWSEVATHSSIVLHGKQYRHMKEWSRPCVVCDAKFSAFENATRADANSQFSNKTCTAHRGLLPALEKGFIAWSKEAGAIVPGAKCGGSSAEGGEDLERLHMMVATMKEELDPLYGRNKELFAEIQVLKAKLATFLLQPAMEAQQNVKPVKPAFDSHALLAADIAAKNKMPWEG